MKKKSLMLTIVLAILGCVLMGLSIYFLYQESFSVVAKTEIELEEANKKIEDLSQKLNDKLGQSVASETQNSAIEPLGLYEGQNVPILEITSVDLSEGGTLEGNNKKSQRLMYSHQIRVFILNIGKTALKDVIFSIKDIYNQPKDKRKTKKIKGEVDCAGRPIDNEELGLYDNIDVNTLNLKSKKMIFSSNLPSSFGLGNYTYDVIVEWDKGAYQMKVNIEEVDGKLSLKYKFYDLKGKEIDFQNLENCINDD